MTFRPQNGSIEIAGQAGARSRCVEEQLALRHDDEQRGTTNPHEKFMSYHVARFVHPRAGLAGDPQVIFETFLPLPPTRTTISGPSAGDVVAMTIGTALGVGAFVGLARLFTGR